MAKTSTPAKTKRRSRSGVRAAIIPVKSENREKSNKNSTENNPVAGDAATIEAHVEEFFNKVAKRFEADAGYGRQHINANGAVHPDAVLTKGNRALVKIATQAIEVLAQRAAMSGNKEAEEYLKDSLATPAEAKKFLADIVKFTRERPKSIQQNQTNAMLNDVAKDLGLNDGEQLVPAKKKAAAKK